MGSDQADDVRRIVEKIGFRATHLVLLLLGPVGLFFSDGCELILMNVVAVSTATELGASDSQRALLSTITLTGFTIGICAGGKLADSIGRCVPVRWSYLFVSICGFCCANSTSYWTLFMFRGLLGISMGSGFTPSIALLSEMTPLSWKMWMRTLQSLAFSVGGMFVIICVISNDATLKHVNWRMMMKIAAVPPALFWMLSMVFLPESPMFLASIGEHSKAKASLAWLNNKGNEIDMDYQTDVVQSKWSPGLFEQLEIIYSRRLWYFSLTAFYAMFCTNLLTYGMAYANPQVLMEVGALSAGKQIFIAQSFNFLWAPLAGVLSSRLPRKPLMLFTLLGSMTVCSTFVLAGQVRPPRSWLLECIFQLSINGQTLVSFFGFTVICQFAVEIYPTLASTTGGAIVMGGGRIAAIFAPLLFEFTKRASGHWGMFYYLMAFVSAHCAVMVCLMPDAVPPIAPKEEPALANSGNDYSAVPQSGTPRG